MKYSKELHDKLRNRTGLHIFNHQVGVDSEDIDAILDEIEELTSYKEKGVLIKFMNEDELPESFCDCVYSAMFNCSHVDGVRLFPYVEDSDERYFLILPKVERHSNG